MGLYRVPPAAALHAEMWKQAAALHRGPTQPTRGQGGFEDKYRMCAL